MLEHLLANGRVGDVVVTRGGDLVGAIGGDVVAMSAAGTVLWRRSGAGRAAVANDGTIYVATVSELAALDADGNERWTRSGSFRTPTITSRGMVVVLAGSEVTAFRGDGSSKWSAAIESVGEVAAASADGTHIYVSMVRGVAALAADGRVEWTVELGGDVATSPAVGGDGTIFVGLQSGRVVALLPGGGMAWSGALDEGDMVRGSIAVGPEGNVYVPGCATMLYAFAPDGQRRWSYGVRPIDCEVVSRRPIVVDRRGLVFIGGAAGVWSFSPFGAMLWHTTASVGGAVDVLIPSADARLYVGGTSSLDVLE